MYPAAMTIVNEYQEQRIALTLRQLYYQLVARDIISNQQREYKRLGTLVTDARYCGLIDWRAIEDRVRVPKRAAQFDDLEDLVDAALRSYRLDRWQDQPYYVELFTEKDALSSILWPIADEHHIYFCVNRGYASATAIYDASKRLQAAIYKDQIPVVLYLGDHDPSGLDMVRDIFDRLYEILEVGRCLKVEHIALTWGQIEEYQPPPNPAKLSDSRAADYIAKHGEESWEVDALPPDTLYNVVHNAIKAYVDPDTLQEVLEQEAADKKRLIEAINL